MTTAAEPALTRKQRQVLAHLERGETPSVVARKLKVSSSNVHGHMRRIRAAGITLPSERTNGDRPEQNTGTKGVEFVISAVAEPEERAAAALADARDAVAARLAVIDQRLGEIHEEVNSLGDERVALEQKRSSYTDALGALNGSANGAAA